MSTITDTTAQDVAYGATLGVEAELGRYVALAHALIGQALYLGVSAATLSALVLPSNATLQSGISLAALDLQEGANGAKDGARLWKIADAPVVFRLPLRAIVSNHGDRACAPVLLDVIDHGPVGARDGEIDASRREMDAPLTVKEASKPHDKEFFHGPIVSHRAVPLPMGRAIDRAVRAALGLPALEATA